MYLKEKFKSFGLYLAKKLAIVIDFGVFLGKKIKADSLTRVAASLSYTSLLALVPLFAIGLAIFAAFPMFADSKEQLLKFIIGNVLPEMGDEVSAYFNDFINASAKLTTIGVVGISITSVLLLSTIENTFNFLFKVGKARNIATKVTMYWTIITLGPLLMGAVFSLKGYAYAFMPEQNVELAYYMGRVIPTIITILLLVAIYTLVPNKKVRIIHSLIGAITTVILFGILKKGFALTVLNGGTYKTLYGAMATLPIILVWLYASWAVILFGAAVTAALEEYSVKRNSSREENNHHYYNDKKPYNNKRNNYQRRDNYKQNQRKSY